MARRRSTAGPQPVTHRIDVPPAVRAAVRAQNPRPGDYWQYVRGQCLGKVAYGTWDAAESARLACIAVRDDGRGPGEVYRCDLCIWWHWGRRGELRPVIPPPLLAEYQQLARSRRPAPGVLPRHLRWFNPDRLPNDPVVQGDECWWP